MTDVEKTDTTLTIRRRLDASRERVWVAWTDPEQVAAWWGPNGFTTTVHEMDVREGGVWQLTMEGPDGVAHQNTFPYEEIVEPERLVYTHPGGEDRPYFRARILIDDRRDGGTELEFVMRFDAASDREWLEDHGGVEAAVQTLDRLADHLSAAPRGHSVG